VDYTIPQKPHPRNAWKSGFFPADGVESFAVSSLFNGNDLTE
jgi:hypothetical protein